MLRNIVIGLATILGGVSCQSTGALPSQEFSNSAVIETLAAAGQANDVDAQKALSANKPLLLVFWQAW
jgi:hypothetical protein